jgi:universal stress protein E
VPVLLVKSRRPYDAVKVLAAVDPSHAFAKSARLDERILRIAGQVSSALRGQLHAVHAYVPAVTDIPVMELTLPDSTTRIVRNAAAAAAARFDATLRAARLGKLPSGRRHLLARHPVDAIPLVAKQQGTGIVVMGLVRTGFKGLFIGNTAEQLLDGLACDLLIVKPPGFRSRVPVRSRGPQLVSLGPTYGAV